jgi:hypothetical protein
MNVTRGFLSRVAARRTARNLRAKRGRAPVQTADRAKRVGVSRAILRSAGQGPQWVNVSPPAPRQDRRRSLARPPLEQPVIVDDDKETEDRIGERPPFAQDFHISCLSRDFRDTGPRTRRDNRRELLWMGKCPSLPLCCGNATQTEQRLPEPRHSATFLPDLQRARTCAMLRNARNPAFTRQSSATRERATKSSREASRGSSVSRREAHQPCMTS